MGGEAKNSSGRVKNGGGREGGMDGMDFMDFMNAWTAWTQGGRWVVGG